MEISIELSLYPLAEAKYKDVIWSFINNLKQYNELTIETNGMSTQVFGEYDKALSIVTSEMKKVHEQTQSAVVILKIIAVDRQRTY